MATTTTAMPAWKVAMQERKKHKEEEEKKKRAEREAYLASVPAWKRPMILKKLEEEEKQALASSKATETSVNVAPVQNKWPQAAKKLDSQPRPSPSSSTPSSSTVPAWKIALQERQKGKSVAEAKKKLEESSEQATANDTHHNIVSPVRKALGERQTIARVKEKFEKEIEVHKIESPSISKKHFKQEVTSSPSGSPSVSKKHFKQQTTSSADQLSTPLATTTDAVHSDEQTSIRLANGVGTNSLQDQEDIKPVVSTSTDIPSTTDITKQSAKKQVEILENKVHVLENRVAAVTEPTKPSAVAKKQVEILEENDPKFQAMPLWKQELMRRKRKQQQNTTKQSISPKVKEVTDNHSTVDNNIKTSADVPAANKPEVANSLNKPEVVNSEANESSPKLVHKEGTTLRAPVITTASKWADITEDDPEFQKLPLWKQTVIRRRREDKIRRTTPVKPQETKQEEKKEEPVSTPWSIELNKQNNREQERVVPEMFQNDTANKNKIDNSDTNDIPSGVGKVQALLGQFSGGQFVKRKTPPAPKKESNVEVTLIDEISSDEEDVSSLKQPAGILKSPKKTGKNTVRRVSWSDTRIAVEHYYPKYDYKDYEEIDQPKAVQASEDQKTPPSDDMESSSSDTNIATPLHPWLNPSPVTNATNNTAATSGSIHSFLPSSGNLSSVGSFMSLYTLGNTSTSTTVESSTDNKAANDNDKLNDEPPDTYANLDSDTAALLF